MGELGKWLMDGFLVCGVVGSLLLGFWWDAQFTVDPVEGEEWTAGARGARGR